MSALETLTTAVEREQLRQGGRPDQDSRVGPAARSRSSSSSGFAQVITPPHLRDNSRSGASLGPTQQGSTHDT